MTHRKLVNRGVAQLGSASALGAEGRGFKSLRPDHLKPVWAFFVSIVS